MSELQQHVAADQQERYDRDDALIIHLSDTHISAAGTNPARPNPQYDARAAFDADCARIAASGLRPNLIAVSGDICDAEVGERAREAYRYVRNHTQALANQLGCPAVYAMGNHDDRAAFREVLLPAVAAQAEGDSRVRFALRSDSPHDPVDYVLAVPGTDGNIVRVIVLDTSIPDITDDQGTVLDEQLAWLDGLLSETAGGAAVDDSTVSTVLVMHHPPVAPWQDRARLWHMHPEDAARLAPVVRGRVRAILCGHVHLSSFATFAGVPVSIAGAHSRNQDPLHARDLTYSWAANYSCNLVLLRGIVADADQVLITPALIAPDSSAD
ncbi:metallophosphoesterase [Bifidobacterium cebidarum]|uniref:Ser/Thr phosphatase family protein n=1 Tax=Bifidobacterium cebidarum TaxID=2650773 RepID=A0A6I1GAT6_9BIFI|nr:metallophosphoesterase [Bifidobacterium cebidarum]KAB7788774.1 Ser/Thr phosphatase family protein [Bifidobacterium cebidarum]